MAEEAKVSRFYVGFHYHSDVGKLSEAGRKINALAVQMDRATARV